MIINNFCLGIPLFVCNDLNYGYSMVPLEENQGFFHEQDNLLNLKLFISGRLISYKNDRMTKNVIIIDYNL